MPYLTVHRNKKINPKKGLFSQRKKQQKKIQTLPSGERANEVLLKKIATKAAEKRKTNEPIFIS